MKTADRKSTAAMFNRITNRYRLTNHVLSGGLDIYWRCRTVKLLKKLQPQYVLDLACGGGELTMELQRLKPLRTVGADISSAMLKKAVRSAQRLQNKIEYIEAPAEKLPFADNGFDLITVAFGLRNFADKQKALQEVRRVLKPGGTLAILEFTLPSSRLIRAFYLLYLKHILPQIGGLCSGCRTPYQYLAASIVCFSAFDLTSLLKTSGFSSIDTHQLFPGACHLIIAKT